MENKNEITLYVPDIGSSNHIKILQWNFKEGDDFKEDDELCDMMSDKATFSLEAPQNGKIKKILKQSQSEVKIKEPVAIVEIYRST